MRIGEAVALSWTDWDPVHHTLRVRTETRRRHVRSVPIPAELTAALLLFRHKGEAHLTGVHRGRQTGQCDLSRPFALTPDRAGARLRRLMRAAGIDPGRSHPHVFRHTFAVRAVRVGMPPLMLARLLGHSSPTTTMGYYHLLGPDVRPFLERMKGLEGAAGPAWEPSGPLRRGHNGPPFPG